MRNFLLDIVSSGVIDTPHEEDWFPANKGGYDIDFGSFTLGLTVGIIGTIILGALIIYIVNCIREDRKKKESNENERK